MTVQARAIGFSGSPVAAHPAALPAGGLARLDPRPSGTRHSWRDGFELWRGRVLRIASPLLILVAWQLVSSFGIVAPQILPPPTDIVAAFRELIALGDLQSALPTSLSRSFTGLAL